MAQAESQLAVQIIVDPPSCPSNPSLPPIPSSSLFVCSLSFPCLGASPITRGQEGVVPPKTGYDRRRRGRVSRVWDMHNEVHAGRKERTVLK
eukprot:2789353-Pyramimonas_sp.AAC.1